MSALLHQARESSAKVRDGVIKFLAMTRRGPQAILARIVKGLNTVRAKILRGSAVRFTT